MPCAFALIIAAAVAHANVILVPAAVSVAGGAMVSVTVMVTNPGTASMTWTVKKSLPARLHSGSSHSEDVVLTTDVPDGGRIIPPGTCNCRIDSRCVPDCSGRSSWNLRRSNPKP